MNFRLVWMGSEDDDPQVPPSALSAAVFRKSTGVHPYALDRGIVRQEKLPGGNLKTIPLANFGARIVRDWVLDDGVDQRREFEIEATLGDATVCFSLTAAEFSRMHWVLERLGPRAIVYPGQHQHTRTAIQWLSGSIPQQRLYSHLGWSKYGEEWMYLHGNGALKAEGPVSGVEVRLPPAFEHYRLVDSRDPIQAIRDSLALLQVARDRISFPLVAGVYCAALGAPGFSLLLAGGSGVFKTALAALCQQHFGAEMDASRLPANFASTANALEALAFHAKDALLVVDDFAPSRTPADTGLESVAERLFRAAGNHQGRSRLRTSDGTSVAHPPRGLILATGEDVPQGQSIRARLLIVDVGPGEVDRNALTGCQRTANQGRFAAAMTSFLTWIAGRYESIQQRRRERIEELRNQGRGRAIHARLPSAAAELQTAFEVFLEFAVETRAIENAERESLLERLMAALDELVEAQAKYHQATDPASRFVSLLRGGLCFGRVYVSGPGGDAPEEPAIWGWKKSSRKAWVPQGVQVGWLAGANLYLDPSVSYESVQQLAGKERLAISQQTLRQRLRERGVLASVDTARQTLVVRRVLEGRPRQVLHLRASDLRN